MIDLLNDLIQFFEARNTGNATNDLLNRCKQAQSEQLPIHDVVGRSEQLCECECEYPIIRTGVTEYCSICQLEVK